MKKLCIALAACSLLIGAATVRDGAVIVNSGSTNIAGYTLQVWSDGAASMGTRSVARPLAKRLFSDLRRAKGATAVSQGCIKSASFGTTMTVTYHGWTSPDLECPVMGALAAVQNDVREVVAALRVSPPGRIRLMPEPRRFPIQASPSPESTKRIS